MNKKIIVAIDLSNLNKSLKLYIICCMISSIQYFIQKKYIDEYYDDSVDKTNKIEKDERIIKNNGTCINHYEL